MWRSSGVRDGERWKAECGGKEFQSRRMKSVKLRLHIFALAAGGRRIVTSDDERVEQADWWLMRVQR